MSSANVSLLHAHNAHIFSLVNLVRPSVNSVVGWKHQAITGIVGLVISSATTQKNAITLEIIKKTSR